MRVLEDFNTRGGTETSSDRSVSVSFSGSPFSVSLSDIPACVVRTLSTFNPKSHSYLLHKLINLCRKIAEASLPRHYQYVVVDHILFVPITLLPYHHLLSSFDGMVQFPGVSGWLPTAAGLGLIPFIVAPLDNLVEEVSRRCC